ncbi:hypothetical protein THAOC_21391 [Thalassiosira oceanica]|uniref:Uncharacterized protein n=1 Tax=Thalassiosira oceanica TaxID=159749 RepID=K0SJ07_THAOC|nr:hypothetical protein THAOC_21391 [Thalassiosira oceanica]|eukprot:EJK58477.1 hypothetical protein THAOC_21391 [Thalassiosira oceanica]
MDPQSPPSTDDVKARLVDLQSCIRDQSGDGSALYIRLGCGKGSEDDHDDVCITKLIDVDLFAMFGSKWAGKFASTKELGPGFHRDKRGPRHFVTAKSSYETMSIGAAGPGARFLSKENDSELIETIRSCITEKATERAAQRKRQTDPPSPVKQGSAVTPSKPPATKKTRMDGQGEGEGEESKKSDTSRNINFDSFAGKTQLLKEAVVEANNASGGITSLEVSIEVSSAQDGEQQDQQQQHTTQDDNEEVVNQTSSTEFDQLSSEQLDRREAELILKALIEVSDKLASTQAGLQRPDVLEQSYACSIIKKCERSVGGVIELKRTDSMGRVYTERYMRLPAIQKRNFSDDAATDQFVYRARERVLAALHHSFDVTLSEQKDLAILVIRQIAKTLDLQVYDLDSVELTIEDVVSLREKVGLGTNELDRLSSALKALIPSLDIFPSQLKRKLAEFDREGNLEIGVQKVPLACGDNQTKLVPFIHLQDAHKLVELMAEASHYDGSYEQSEEFMTDKYSNKLVCTYNTDKGGGDITTSTRLVNRKGGNSNEYTKPIACISGKPDESYGNLIQTVYSDKFPIRGFLQGLVDDRYFMLTVAIGNQYQCLMFEPRSPDVEPMTNRFIGVVVMDGTLNDTDVIFFKDNRKVREVPSFGMSVSTEAIQLKFVVNEAKRIVGVQIRVGGVDKLCLRFKNDSLFLGTKSVSEVKAATEQVVGFPVHDGKQQVIVAGITSNSVINPCPNCTLRKLQKWLKTRDLPARFRRLAIRLGLFIGPSSNPANFTGQGVAGPGGTIFPDDTEAHPDPILRTGRFDTLECAERWLATTANGTRHLTGVVAEEAKEACVSVSRKPGLREWPQKRNGDPLHIGQGIGNKANEYMRNGIRAVEEGSDFMKSLKEAMSEIGELLGGKLSFASKSDNTLAGEHAKSIGFQKRVRLLEQKIAQLHKRREELNNDGQSLGLDRSQTPLPLNGDEAAEAEAAAERAAEAAQKIIDTQIEQLRARANAVLVELEEHAEASSYGHFVQLQLGLVTLHDALDKFLKDSSKRERGKLEYVFNQSIQVFGGTYGDQHGGFNLTNGRILRELENFDKIATACRAAYPAGHSLHEVVQEMFDRYELFAKNFFNVAKLMKSQRKIDSEEFDGKLLDMILAYDAAFPDESYITKLHFLVYHIPDFVEEYGALGRLSAESHESIHTMLDNIKDSVKHMTDTQKMYEHMFARINANLKPKVQNSLRKIEVKWTGKPRGKYNTHRATKLQDRVKYEKQVFAGEVTVDGDKYLKLKEGGVIPEKYLDVFL